MPVAIKEIYAMLYMVSYMRLFIIGRSVKLCVHEWAQFLNYIIHWHGKAIRTVIAGIGQVPIRVRVEKYVVAIVCVQVGAKENFGVAEDTADSIPVKVIVGQRQNVLIGKSTFFRMRRCWEKTISSTSEKRIMASGSKLSKQLVPYFSNDSSGWGLSPSLVKVLIFSRKHMNLVELFSFKYSGLGIPVVV